MKRQSDKKLVLYICLAMALATLGVYWQVSRYEFINLDDLGYVGGNPHVRYGFTLEGIKWAFGFSGYASNWHPVTWLSHMLDCELFGVDAGAGHLVNLFLHIANSLLLFIILRQITGAIWRSAFVAALFALHPLHVESVAWIAERKDVLSTFFGLLTVWAYVWYVKRCKISIYLLMAVFFALGLMSKPMLVTLPFVLLLLDYWPLERFGKRTVYYLILEKVPLFAMSAVSSVITFIVQRKGGAVMEIGLLPLKIRIVNALVSYVKYIGKMICPRHLAIFYPHSKGNISLWQIIGAVSILIIVTSLALWKLRKRPYIAVGWLWFLGTLVPVIGLVQVGGLAMADRYTYVPLAGLFIIIAWGAGDAAAKWRYKKIILGASAMIILSTMAICTWFQAGYWRNSMTLFEHAIEITKGNYVAHQCLAGALRAKGDIEGAIEHYHRSLQINENSVPANVSLGAVLIDAGKTDEGIKYLTKAIELKPRSSKARPYGELGRAMTQKGRIDEAIVLYEKAIELEPDWVNAINSLAWHLATYNDDKVRNPDRALKLAKRASELTNYSSPEVLDTLAAAYAAAGDFGKAVEIAEKALRLCQSGEKETLRKEIENRLILYKAGKDYVENQ